MACAALIFVTALAAQHYQSRAIHTPAEAISAACQKVNEFQSRTSDLNSWAWPIVVERKGDQWILHRRAYEPKDSVPGLVGFASLAHTTHPQHPAGRKRLNPLMIERRTNELASLPTAHAAAKLASDGGDGILLVPADAPGRERHSPGVTTEWARTGGPKPGVPNVRRAPWLKIAVPDGNSSWTVAHMPARAPSAPKCSQPWGSAPREYQSRFWT
jgi:hypothetical protein